MAQPLRHRQRTRAKTLDDTGNHRTQYAVGPQDGNFPHALRANQVDRSLSQNNQTNTFNLTRLRYPHRPHSILADQPYGQPHRRRMADLRHLPLS